MLILLFAAIQRRVTGNGMETINIDKGRVAQKNFKTRNQINSAVTWCTDKENLEFMRVVLLSLRRKCFPFVYKTNENSNICLRNLTTGRGMLIKILF